MPIEHLQQLGEQRAEGRVTGRAVLACKGAGHQQGALTLPLSLRKGVTVLAWLRLEGAAMVDLLQIPCFLHPVNEIQKRTDVSDISCLLRLPHRWRKGYLALKSWRLEFSPPLNYVTLDRLLTCS